MMGNAFAAPAAFFATIAVNRGDWEELAYASLAALLAAVLQWLTSRRKQP